MKAFLKLIRWQNLVIVIVTMLLMRYAIIAPVIGKIGVVFLNGKGRAIPMVLQFPWYDFILLVIATVCITAGGYVINDYFDIKTDLINLFKLPTKKLNGKLETSILSPLNTIREPWCDNAIFMMHRMDWNPVDNEIDVEIVELFTSSFFLLEDGSGYYLMEDGVSHYNY